jgi:predicted ester cyclase
MTPDENKALIRRWIEEVWNKNDYRIVDELIPPDAREGVKQWHAMLHRAFPDAQFTIEEMIAEGDKVVVRWTGAGTHLGEWDDGSAKFAPTGKHVTLNGMVIYRIAAGMLVQHWANADDLGVLQQLGVLPASDNR